MFLFKNYSSWCVSYHTQRKNHLAPNETNHRALKVQTRRHVSFVFLFTHKSMGERDTHTQIKTSFHFVTETYSCLPFNSLSGQSPGMIPLTTIVKLGLSMASQCPQVTPNDHKILSAPANVYLGHTSPSPHRVPVNKHWISYLFLSSSENLNRYLSHSGIALNYYL